MALMCATKEAIIPCNMKETEKERNAKARNALREFEHLNDDTKNFLLSIYQYWTRQGQYEKIQKFADGCPFMFIGMCESPVEEIFLVAFSVISILRTGGCIPIHPQECVDTPNGKAYYPDFTLRSKDERTLIAIEIDGHEFHEKTKEQVEYRNKRDMQLKMAGYEILRFSGTEINKDVFGCVDSIFDYLNKKIKDNPVRTPG